jgi:hypothetical protein
MTKPETEKLPISDADIIAIRDEHLPNQGESFDCLAFGRSVALAAIRAQGGGATPDAAPDAVTDEMVERAARVHCEAAGTTLDDLRGLVRQGILDVTHAALTAAIAHARSAGGEGNARVEQIFDPTC